MQKEKVVNISVRLEADMGDKLAFFSEKTGRPKSWFIRKALEAYLAEHEDMLMAVARLEDDSDEIMSAREMWESLDVGN